MATKQFKHDNFSSRVIMSMLIETAAMTETAQRIRIQTLALAKEHGIRVPPIDQR